MSGAYHPADFVVEVAHECALVAPIAREPELAETFNVWLYDSLRDTGFNIHPRAAGGTMISSVTAFLPGGRIARADFGGPGRFSDPLRPASTHVALEVVEPLEHWRVLVDEAPVWITSDTAQAAGATPDTTPTSHVTIAADVFNAAPFWVNGALLPESRQTIGDLVGSWYGNRLSSGFDPSAFRYDVLARGRGVICFEGVEYPFDGVGLRGHVRGVRSTVGMIAHCWAEGLSADGSRGFGASVHMRAGGGYEHSEAFVWQDGRMVPARIIHTPHLDRDATRSSSVFELACDELGLVRIEAEDLRQFWWRMDGWGVPPIRYGADPNANVLMKQALARFRWADGTIGHGLVERSG